MNLRSRRIIIYLAVALCLFAIILVGYQFDWVGFGAVSMPGGTFTPAKTLWDWLQLFLVPVVLFGLAQWFSQTQQAAELRQRRSSEQFQLI